jgi:hypothetical protein
MVHSSDRTQPDADVAGVGEVALVGKRDDARRSDP